VVCKLDADVPNELFAVLELELLSVLLVLVAFAVALGELALPAACGAAMLGVNP